MKLLLMIAFLAYLTYQAFKTDERGWYFFCGWEAAFIAMEMTKG